MKNHETNLIVGIFCLVFCGISIAATMMHYTVWNLVYAIAFGIGAILCVVSYFFNRGKMSKLSVNNETNLATAIVCGIGCIVAIIATIMSFSTWNLTYVIVFAVGCAFCIYAYIENRK